MKKSIYVLLTICLFCTSIFFTACSKRNTAVSKTGCYFDTVITITLYCKDADRYMEECFSIAQKYEDLFSATKEGSDIYKLNHNQGQPLTLNPETVTLIQSGMDYAKASDGSFDLSVGELSSLWQDAIKAKQVPDKDDIATALSAVSWKNIVIKDNQVQLNNNAQIDLGGIAKGYIADRMKEYLLSQGIQNGLINLGGNVLAVGPKDADSSSYNIAIQKPFSEDGEPVASVKITDQSVVTSGTYQRYFEEKGHVYHHILDLDTGYPCENNLDSVTIICNKSIDGDALSTTVFLMGLKSGMEYVESLADTEAIFITKDGTIYKTSGIGTTIPYEAINQ